MTGLESVQAETALEASRSAPQVPKNASPRQLRQVAEDFEAVFLSEMLQPMFDNLEPAEPFGGGPGGELWRQMQVDEYGKAIARSGGIGIADAVMEQLLRAQEGI